MAHPDPLHYRYIETDYGGTYTHRPQQPSDTILDAETFPAIGTYGCSSCVAVYMKLSPSSCFFAHINASKRLPGSGQIPSDDGLYSLHIVTDAESAYVRDEVFRLLRGESVFMSWPPLEQISQVVIACPHLKHPVSGETLSGTYVVQAIRDFLGRQAIPVNTESEGFAVTYDTGHVDHFPWSDRVMDNSKPDDRVNFTAHKVHWHEWPRWFIEIGRLSEERIDPALRASSVAANAST